MGTIQIDPVELKENPRRNEWILEHCEPRQFPKVGSIDPVYIDSVSITDLEDVIPDRIGFMFKYPIYGEGRFWEGHPGPLFEHSVAGSGNLPGLESVLRGYLREERDIQEARGVLGRGGNQIYVGRGIVLVKSPHGISQADKREGHDDRTWRISPTIDLAPHIKRLLGDYPEVTDLLDRLREYGGERKRVREGDLLPLSAKLIRYEASRGGSAFLSDAVSTFLVEGNSRGISALDEGRYLPLLYLHNGWDIKIALPSVIDPKDIDASFVLATVDQKIPDEEVI